MRSAELKEENRDVTARWGGFSEEVKRPIAFVFLMFQLESKRFADEFIKSELKLLLNRKESVFTVETYAELLYGSEVRGIDFYLQIRKGIVNISSSTHLKAIVNISSSTHFFVNEERSKKMRRALMTILLSGSEIVQLF